MLSTSHDTLDGYSLLNSSFIMDAGQQTNQGNFEMDLRFFGDVQNLVSNSIPIGSLNNRYEFSINDVTNGFIADISSWLVNGFIYDDIVTIETQGKYDVELYLEIEDQNYILKDRLVIGWVENNEPDIIVNNVLGSVYQLETTNNPNFVDSIAWSVDSGGGIFTEVLDPLSLTLIGSRHVILCEYFVNGELINYKSRMIEGVAGTSVVNVHDLFESINAQSLSLDSKVEVSIKYNGETFSTINSEQPALLDISNISAFTDPGNNEQLLKADLVLSLYLHASPQDSILLDVDGVIGIKRFPE